MAKDTKEAIDEAAVSIAEVAFAYIDESVPARDLVTGALLFGHFMSQQPPDGTAAALLAPLFQFVADVQAEAQGYIEQARKALTPDEAWDAVAAYSPTISPPSIDVWGTKY